MAKINKISEFKHFQPTKLIKYIYICIIFVMIALFCFGFFVNLWANKEHMKMNNYVK